MNLPDSFLTLHAAGRFDYWAGAKHGDLDQATRQKLGQERRGTVLWLNGVEWDTAPAEVAERDDLRPGLFVFASNGRGDVYAFYPAWQGSAAEPPVVFVPHDEPTASVYAPTFATMLYRLWLEHGTYWDPQYDGDDRERALAAWAAIIAPVLDAPRRAELESLSGDPGKERLKAALDTFVAALPKDALGATLPPTKYNPKFVKGDRAKRLYDESIAFYEALVAEGHPKYQAQLDEARANRDAALAG